MLICIMTMTMTKDKIHNLSCPSENERDSCKFILKTPQAYCQLQERLDSTEKWLRMREFWRFTKQIYRNASRVRDQFFVYDKNEDDSKISLQGRRKI